jgi:pimeloyl-ACP methyl ester carboxylesterase
MMSFIAQESRRTGGCAVAEYVDLTDCRIAYERRGHGEPVVLLHGIPSDGRVWSRQLAGLADEFTVIAWDAPGCGRSSDRPLPFGTREVAASLQEFIAALGLQEPHVLGLSWGTSVALELSRLAPDAAASIVLAGGYAGWAGSLPPDVVAQRRSAYDIASRSRLAEVLQASAHGFFGPSPPPGLTDEFLSIASDFPPETLAMLARSFAETDLRSVLPTIKVPTLVLHGDADARSPLDVGQALHAAIPASQLVVLPGVGHLSNMEAPEPFNNAVRTFLRPVPR